MNINLGVATPEQNKVTPFVLKSQGISLKSTANDEQGESQGLMLNRRFRGLSRTYLKVRDVDQELKIIKNRALTNDPLLASAQLNSEPADDPFYFGNIKKSSNFSPFRLLFDGNSEHNSVCYPFNCKNAKAISKPKVFLKVSKKTKLDKLPNCKCHIAARKSGFHIATHEEVRESLPFLREVKKVVQTLYRIFFFPQKAFCFKNIIIIYFENTFCTCKPVLQKKHGTWKTLRNLSYYFQIVLVVQDKRLKDFILTIIESKKLQISGLYCINDHSGVSRRCCKFLDYSQIYYDFEILTPQSNCLIISSHCLSEIPVDAEGQVFDKTRSWTHLLVSGVPVASYEFWETPCLIVVPQVRKDSNCEVFKKFLNDLDELFVEFKRFRDNLDFFQFFLRFGYKIFKTPKAHHLYLDFIDGHLLDKEYGSDVNKSRIVVYCGLHMRYYKQFKLNKPVNNFILF